MQSAQYRTINSIVIADTVRTACVIYLWGVSREARRVEKVTEVVLATGNELIQSETASGRLLTDSFEFSGSCHFPYS